MTTPATPEEPQVVQVAVRFRNQLLAMERKSAVVLIQAYTPIWNRLQADITSLLHEAQDRALGPAQIERLARFQELQRQIAEEVGKFAKAAGRGITSTQLRAIDLASRGAKVSVDAALPPGIDTRILARAGIEWTTLPLEAFSNMVGFTRDGAPLAQLLDEIGPMVREGVKADLLEGIALGQSPRVTAEAIRNRVGMGLTRSLTISRTETLRSFREAGRLQYSANSRIVTGYRRVSAKDGSVCMACSALDNTHYKTSMALDEHPNGRCAVVPETATYRSLGIPVDTPPFQRQTSRDWFRGLPETEQLAMMGPARFDAWKVGHFELEDMAKVTRNAVWGASATAKPVKELVFGQ